MNLLVIRAAGVVLAGAVLLAGCTDADWAKTMSYVGVGEQENPPAVSAQPRSSTPSPAPAMLAGAPPAPNAWCLAVATGDKDRAETGGFDLATQQQVFVTSYTQCVALFGDSSPP